MAMRMILPAWFDHLKERFSYKESKFNEFNMPLTPKSLVEGRCLRSPGAATAVTSPRR